MIHGHKILYMILWKKKLYMNGNSAGWQLNICKNVKLNIFFYWMKGLSQKSGNNKETSLDTLVPAISAATKKWIWVKHDS
jgi:hypothetical protein